MITDWTEVRSWCSWWHTSGSIKAYQERDHYCLCQGPLLKMPWKHVILKCKMQSSPGTPEVLGRISQCHQLPQACLCKWHAAAALTRLVERCEQEGRGGAPETSVLCLWVLLRLCWTQEWEVWGVSLAFSSHASDSVKGSWSNTAELFLKIFSCTGSLKLMLKTVMHKK